MKRALICIGIAVYLAAVTVVAVWFARYVLIPSFDAEEARNREYRQSGSYWITPGSK